MKKYEFILSDGSHVAVQASSEVEAAKIVREMIRNS